MRKKILIVDTPSNGQYRPQLQGFKGLYKKGGTWAAPNFYADGGKMMAEFGMTVPFVAPLLPSYHSAPMAGTQGPGTEFGQVTPIKTNKQVQQTAKEAKNYLVQKGLKPHEAAGVVGNLIQESAMDPGITNSIGAFGLAQWLGPRKKALVSWAKGRGKDPSDLYTQLDYIMEEPMESAKMLNALSKTKTASQAAATFSQIYERPGKAEANNHRRAGYAENLMYKNGGVYDLSMEQIHKLKSMGYDLDII